MTGAKAALCCSAPLLDLYEKAHVGKERGGAAEAELLNPSPDGDPPLRSSCSHDQEVATRV
jgi:hypothetical protein